MKKTIAILLAVILASAAVAALAQAKIGLCITGEITGKQRAVYNAVLAEAINQHDGYTAVDDLFPSALSQEEAKDYNAIAAEGRSQGVKYVLVADVSIVNKETEEFKINGRLIDVRTARVEKTAEAVGPGKSLNDKQKVAVKLVNNLLGASDSDVKYNGHEYVDLGLPSGLKWATCNVGASTPSDYGNYYAWGETTAKPSYDDKNSLMFGRNKSELQSAGIINSAWNLTMSYDAARTNWGGNWRMPTERECEELKDKCTWTWTSQGGHNGYRVTGPNGKSIFLPAAGFRSGTSLYDDGENGAYWSSTYCGQGDFAYGLFFSSSFRNVGWNGRNLGRSVRAVAE